MGKNVREPMLDDNTNCLGLPMEKTKQPRRMELEQVGLSRQLPAERLAWCKSHERGLKSAWEAVKAGYLMCFANLLLPRTCVSERQED